MILKKAISLLLIIATLTGCMTGLISCNKTQTEVSEGPQLAYTSDVVVDFNNTSVISGAGLTAATDNVKTASNAGVWNASASKTVSLQFSKTDLSSYKEVSVWINNKGTQELRASFRLVSDDGSTSEKDSYGAIMSIMPGWHNYTLPLSELYEQYENLIISGVSTVGSPLGLESITELTIEVFSANAGELLIDSVYAKTQKFGTIQGQQYQELKNAVCFYEDSNGYLYDMLRYVLDEADTTCAVKADTKTTYVPVEVLAAHRGATDIVASAEKVSFNYNGNTYEFTPDSTIEYIGVDGGFNPGRALSSKPMVIKNYIMLPMEKCAEIFGYELFYDQMGLAIFSVDAVNYDSTANYDYIYDLIEVIAYTNYNGYELIENMNELYGEDYMGPRLILNESDFDRLKLLVETDPVYAGWFKNFEAKYAKGTTTYSNNAYKFVLSDGYRLLGMSRDVMAVLVPYAFLYRMTGNEDYSNKCYKVMEMTTRFRDNDITGALSWHPEHFLDTGELMYGYAIAYDWCREAFDEKQLQKLHEGIWELGYGAAMGHGELYEFWINKTENLEKLNAERAEEGLPKWDGNTISRAPYQVTGVHDGALDSKAFNFDRNNWSNNWNAVCNGGIITMAIAFANVDGDFREASEWLLDGCLYTVPAGMKEGYAPDGGYPESPGYWSYGTNYSINFISSMLSACGTDTGFINAPGFRESFYFINYVSSTSKGQWSYHDTGEGMPDMNRFFWFATEAQDANIGAIYYNSLMKTSSVPDVWGMMFYDPQYIADTVEMSLDKCYYGIDTATFRSDWTDDAMFCGLHGGANAASHGNLDIGNFILEYGGTRFFWDLGADEYNLKNPDWKHGVVYFTNPYRYWLYREKAEGQNTLVINPEYCDTSNKQKGDAAQGKNYDQLLGADSQILDFRSGETQAYAVVDMGCAYHDAKSGVRGLYVTDDRSTVIIQDEMKLTKSKDNEVYWMAHVLKGGEIELSEDKQTAFITYEGKTLVCSIVLPEGYTGTFEFRRMAANYLPVTGLVTISGEENRDNIQKLVAYSNNVPADLNIAIVCRLLNDGQHSYEWTPIDEWVVD